MAGTQGKIFKAGLLANLHSVTANKELTSQPVPWRMLSYVQLTSYTVQDHLSRDGTAYGGPGPTKLITNQNNSPTDFLTNQSNLGNSSVGTLFSGNSRQ